MDILLVAILLFLCLPEIKPRLQQNDLDNMAQTLKIRARVLDNLEFPRKHRVCYYLTNTGNKPFKETGWIMYFDSFRSIEPDHLPLPGTVYLESQFVNVTLIQGQFTAITPEVGFGILQPGETKQLYFFNELWSVARYEFMPNWYLGSVSDDLEPRIIQSTSSNDFVDPFENAKQWKRSKDDIYNPFSPEERFERNFVEDTGRANHLVIPTPYKMDVNRNDWLHLDMLTCKIHANAELLNEVEILQEASGCAYEKTKTQTENVIYLTTDGGKAEEYSLRAHTSNSTVHIHGKSQAGVFYGIQTLLSILSSSKNGRFPVIHIEDKPRFPYRGMHLDVARNFHGVDEVKRLIKVMAMYKMNKLHLHLSDDDGWRLEIKGLEELTEVGGRRCHDLLERKCLLPQLGSGPFTNNSGSGYFTASDYQNILRFAVRHHIEIIPEFDFPGHSHAAVRAMEARYHFYKNSGNESAGNEFRLMDPNDTSNYLSIQEFNDTAINPCIESTYNFIEHVVQAVLELHSSIQPLQMFHFGGDEVVDGAWVKSPACEQLHDTNQALIGHKALKKYFVQSISNISARFNLSLAGWEDGFIDENNEPYPRSYFNNPERVAYSWDNVWEWGVSMRAYRLANRGYKVVMSQATHLYFDHPAEPDPEERGLNWATRYTDTKKVFGFMPENLYENIDTLLSGQKTNKSHICGETMEKCDLLEQKENVIGMQGQLWSEIVRTPENLHFMIFPRLLALAERAWHKAEWESIADMSMRKTLLQADWAEFANTLGYKELQRLDEIGVNYRVPPPGARSANLNIEVCSSFPGLSVQYSIDNGTTWRPVPQGLKQPQTTVLLRTLSADGKRHSRLVTLQKPTTNGGTVILRNMFNTVSIFCIWTLRGTLY